MDEVLSEKEQYADRKRSAYPPNIKLRRERELRGWSQTALAEQIGAQTQLVTRWEKGNAFPSPYYREKLCLLFAKNAEELGLIKNTPLEEPLLTGSDRQETPINDHTPETNDREYSRDEPLRSPDDPLRLSGDLSRSPTDPSRPSVLSETADTEETYDEQDNASYQDHLRDDAAADAAEVSKQHSAQKGGLARRTVIAGALGGAALLAGAGAWSLGVFTRSSAVSPTPGIALVYTYKTNPPWYVNFAMWSPRGGSIACATGDSTIQVFNARNGNVQYVYRGHNGYTEGVAWAPDGERIASASADKTVRVWRPWPGGDILTYKGHSKAVYCVCWSHDGTRVASSGEDTTVQIWDAFSGTPIYIYRRHTKRVWNITWSPDDQSIATCGEDGGIHVWNPFTGEESKTFTYSGPSGTVTEIAWAPHSRQIVSTHEDGSVHILDALSGYNELTYTGHTAVTNTARWSPDSKLIASGDVEGTVHIWNAMSGKTLFTYKHDYKTSDKPDYKVTEVSWSPDGRQLASSSQDTTLQVHKIIV